MTFLSPAFVTETDEAVWTDCTWSAGLMLCNKASATAALPHGKYPATRVEREALRAASGDRTGGSSLYDLRLGIAKRYGWTLPVSSISWASLLARLKRGDGAEVQGLYSKLPVHYQRWDPHFASTGDRSAHAMYVQGHDRAGNQHIGPDGVLTDVFLMDPLGRGTYRGEWLPVGALRAFCNGLGYMAVATMAQGAIKSPTAPPPPPPEPPEPPAPPPPAIPLTATTYPYASPETKYGWMLEPQPDGSIITHPIQNGDWPAFVLVHGGGPGVGDGDVSGLAGWIAANGGRAVIPKHGAVVTETDVTAAARAESPCTIVAHSYGGNAGLPAFVAGAGEAYVSIAALVPSADLTKRGGPVTVIAGTGDLTVPAAVGQALAAAAHNAGHPGLNVAVAQDHTGVLVAKATIDAVFATAALVT